MAATQQALQTTLDSLKIILEDQETFSEVVNLVFTDLDINHNDKLETGELQQYISRSCAALGVRDLPNQEQVLHLFKHLDLNNDKAVTKDELAVFLKHLFREQLKDCAEKLRTKAHKSQHHPTQHQPERSHAERGVPGALVAPLPPTRRAPSLSTAVSLKATPRKLLDREHPPDGAQDGFSAVIRESSTAGSTLGTTPGVSESSNPGYVGTGSLTCHADVVSPRRNAEVRALACTSEAGSASRQEVTSDRHGDTVGLASPRTHDVTASASQAVIMPDTQGPSQSGTLPSSSPRVQIQDPL